MRQNDIFYRDQVSHTDFTKGSSLYDSYAPHSCDRIEMWYLSAGEADAFSNGNKVHLTAGTFFLVFPNQVHSYENISKDAIITNLIIHPSKLSHYKKIFTEKVSTSSVCRPNDDRLLDLLELALDEYNQGSDEKIVNSIITAFLGKLLNYYDLVNNSVSNNKVSEVLTYCQEHFRENLSLDKISAELFISRSYLSYIFNKKLKISFSDYISSLRIFEVLELIETSGYSISRAAYEAGFTGLSNFNRIFKKIYGTSPREHLTSQINKHK